MASAAAGRGSALASELAEVRSPRSRSSVRRRGSLKAKPALVRVRVGVRGRVRVSLKAKPALARRGGRAVGRGRAVGGRWPAVGKCCKRLVVSSKW